MVLSCSLRLEDADLDDVWTMSGREIGRLSGRRQKAACRGTWRRPVWALKMSLGLSWVVRSTRYKW